LIAFNEKNASTVMPFFGQELFERAQAKGTLNDARAGSSATTRGGSQAEGLLAALDRYSSTR
jgi:amidase